LTQWRVTHTSRERVVLRPVSPSLAPLFEEINGVQFAPRGDACDSVVTASGQWIGASTQGDLKHQFIDWYNGRQDKPFVPLWVDRRKPANESFPIYLEPFCNQTSSPTARQDCFFLPMSNCMMGAQQWERIRTQTTNAGRLHEVTIESPRRKKKSANLGISSLSTLWSMLFFRQNARTRSEVARREIAWRAQNPSWPAIPMSYSEQPDASVTCAALHIRRGDKLTPFWMKVHHTINQGYNRTLDEYLDEALNLLQSTTGVSVGAKARVMVMSDDADIIEAAKKTKRATTFHVDQAIQSVSEALKGGDVEGPGLFGKIYGDSGSEDILQWLLTIRLMSACDVFVGNLLSGFTRFVYHEVCEQRRGNCPKAVTLGCGSDTDPDFNVSISQPSVVEPATCS